MPAHARSRPRSHGSSIGTPATVANTSLQRTLLCQGYGAQARTKRSPLNSISLGDSPDSSGNLNIQTSVYARHVT
jgi:hypothetical protein